jgi:hypothetical protein
MEYLDRLAALGDEAALTPELWAEVHGEIQEQLALLETTVRQKVAGIRVDAGRTQGTQFFLFSYRTFSVPGRNVDPAVAGITFTPAQEGVKVAADVSGEETGDQITSVPSKRVAKSRGELLEAARESARELSKSAEAIAAAITDPSRKVA